MSLSDVVLATGDRAEHAKVGGAAACGSGEQLAAALPEALAEAARA